MSSGTAPSSAWCIEWKSILELAKVEAEALQATLSQYGIDWDQFARAFDESGPDADEAPPFGIDEQDATDIENAYVALRQAFAKATTVNGEYLDIFIGWWDIDDAEPYDELDESHFWVVEGARTWTAPGEKYNHLIEHKSWTTYG